MAQHQVNTAGLDVHSLSEASMNAVAVSRRRVENTICSFLAALLLRRRIGTFYLLAHSDLNKSTTVCKVGDLEVFPKAFLDLETYTRP